ncbi:hypothetical protein M426DRAFT_317486, partial [Hypoxylon sp. CI-4A]
MSMSRLHHSTTIPDVQVHRTLAHHHPPPLPPLSSPSSSASSSVHPRYRDWLSFPSQNHPPPSTAIHLVGFVTRTPCGSWPSRLQMGSSLPHCVIKPTSHCLSLQPPKATHSNRLSRRDLLASYSFRGSVNV